jgi:hypothetical protein
MGQFPYIGQTSNSNSGGPFIPMLGLGDNDFAVKQAHDQYDVYVNGELVGHKVLLNETDHVDDVADFLTSRGIHDFTTNLEGDHYNVKVDDGGLEQDVKNNLTVYLDIR